MASAIRRTKRWLLEHQHADGYWCGELEGDTILESEYILLLAWLGEETSPQAVAAARYLLAQQQPHGGWSQYPGGPIDISGSVKAYFALKLTGQPIHSQPMTKAREAILAAGGADAVNSFTRFYLALLGQISYDHCPAVPPEAVLLPTWLPLNIYRVSAWSRTILVPLAIMWAHRPVRTLPQDKGISELYLAAPENWPLTRCVGLAEQRGWFTWDRFFRTVDSGVKWCERHGVRPFRKRALAAAESWMIERFQDSDGLGAIFPPMVWSLIALRCLGYPADHPVVIACRRQIEELAIDEEVCASGETSVHRRLQPCLSPVWDTAIALRALAAADNALESEGRRDPQLDQAASLSAAKAADWLLSKEVRREGDWSRTVKTSPGGWFFEHNNAFYPDVDDTIMVVMALREQFFSSRLPHDGSAGQETLLAEARIGELSQARTHVARIDRLAAACQRGMDWVLAMQNRDGGWGAFDKDNDASFLCRVPFADHNAMIDPSTPDLTGRVLEALGICGLRVGHPAIDRAVAYLRQTQEADGSWFGRWGVNYIYGTWQSIVGLAAVGVSADDSTIAKAANWLTSHQSESGGWGESVASYDDPTRKGRGPATASQTAWAILGLAAAGRIRSPAVARGCRYLLETQGPDGAWPETEFTGTGFPRVFYLRYHLYPIYFPLLALAKVAAARQEDVGASAPGGVLHAPA